MTYNSLGVGVVGSSGEGQTGAAHSGTRDVFISYASHDAAAANNVAAALEGEGLGCWIAPRDVTPGTHYASEIVHAIDSAKATVLILSQDAASSPHVLREIERATSKRHPVVTLRLDKAPLPAEFEYFLNTSQWLDASGGDIARSIPRLIAAVQVAIKAPVLTPEAVRKQGGPAPSPSARLPKRKAIIAASLITLAIAGFSIDRLLVGSRLAAPHSAPAAAAPAPVPAPASPTIPEKSVAVLPFVDMSEQKNEEYFADGLSEELIDQLARIPGLKVIARTSSFSFKSKANTVVEIARVLGVTHVLEGSVRRSGNKIRVTAQLVRADNGYYLWSETYERTLVDVFATEDDISRAVLGALKVSLGNETPATVHEPPPEAYDFYLQGLAVRFEKATAEKRIALLKKAVEADPNFARAWATLGSNLAASVEQNWRSHASTLNEARNAIQHAVALAPNASETHHALCRYHDAIEWDREAALRECEARVQVDPGNAGALTELASLLIEVRGDSPRVKQLYLKAIDIDPINKDAYFNFGSYLVNSGRLEEGERAIRRFLQLDPTADAGRSFLVEALTLQGEVDEALSENSKVRDTEQRLLYQALAYHKKRATEAAAAALAFDARFGEANPYDSATLHAFRGEPDQALARLQQAVSAREGSVFWMGQDILLNSLHNDPRFKALLRKVHLPE